jgi:hypothetical protein
MKVSSNIQHFIRLKNLIVFEIIPERDKKKYVVYFLDPLVLL